jgi:hypothetical protein
MFTNPASSDPGTQQPGIPANAIKVAARLAPLGATVTIRLADWFPGFYSFTTLDDWFGKLATTVAAKKAANLTNIYAYEIWNEPNGTYGDRSAASFNDFWRQSFVKLRQLDPGAKITGPSISWYDEGFLRPFLTYAKSNNCLPDIVGWHEGTGINIEGDVQRYRSLEKELGIGPLPITMNEYSGAGWAKDEGRPGASAPLIAQLERAGVETACISWWTPDSIAGHLGSLLATDAQSNGGWFLYKWYGDMTGNMVATTPSLAKDSKNLDGFASLDTAAGHAAVILGGVNDGTVQVIVKGFRAAPVFGDAVHAVVERTHWTGRSGVVASPETLSTVDTAIANDQISVSISNANADDGYRVSLTRAGVGTGGRAGTGGASGGGGAVGADAGPRDAIATGGAAGNPGTGGGVGGQTSSDGRMDAGDDGPGSGGASGTGEVLATGGASAAAPGSGGVLAGRGGVTGNGGSVLAGRSGAMPGAGGATAIAGRSASGGSGGAVPGKPTGCSCRIGSPTPPSEVLLLLLALLPCCRRGPRQSRNRIHLLGNRHLVPRRAPRGQFPLPRKRKV